MGRKPIGRTPKYFAHKVEYDGHSFDSKMECEVYKRLKADEERGDIKDLQLQPKFEILPKLTKFYEIQLKTKRKAVERVDERAKYYTADFSYIEVDTGKKVVLEVKSRATAAARDYPLRRHLIKLCIRNYNNHGYRPPMEFKEIIKG